MFRKKYRMRIKLLRNMTAVRRAEARDGYIFIAPQMILFAIFLVYPVVEGFRLSLYDTSFIGAFYVGLENYKNLFADPIFLLSIKNTMIFVFFVTVLTVGVGFIIAASIFDKKPGYVSFIRGCYYLPTIIGMTVLSLIWLWLLNPAYGVVNYYMERLGMERINFVGDLRTVIPVLVIMTWLVNIGQAIILYVASMSGISTDLFEASDIDGTTRWQKVRYILAPLTRPTTTYLTVLSIISVIKVFVVIHLMTSGGPNYASVTMMYLSYLEAFKFGHMGTGAAIGVIMFVIVWLLSMIILVAMRKKD